MTTNEQVTNKFMSDQNPYNTGFCYNWLKFLCAPQFPAPLGSLESRRVYNAPTVESGAHREQSEAGQKLLPQVNVSRYPNSRLAFNQTNASNILPDSYELQHVGILPINQHDNPLIIRTTTGPPTASPAPPPLATRSSSPRHQLIPRGPLISQDGGPSRDLHGHSDTGLVTGRTSTASGGDSSRSLLNGTVSKMTTGNTLRTTITTTATVNPLTCTRNPPGGSGAAAWMYPGAGDAGSISLSGWSEDAASLKTLDRLIGLNRRDPNVCGTISDSGAATGGPAAYLVAAQPLGATAGTVECIRENGESVTASNSILDFRGSSVCDGSAGHLHNQGTSRYTAGGDSGVHMNGYYSSIGLPQQVPYDSISQVFYQNGSSVAPISASRTRSIGSQPLNLENDSYCNLYEGSGTGSSITAGTAMMSYSVFDHADTRSSACEGDEIDAVSADSTGNHQRPPHRRQGPRQQAHGVGQGGGRGAVDLAEAGERSPRGQTRLRTPWPGRLEVPLHQEASYAPPTESPPLHMSAPLSGSRQNFWTEHQTPPSRPSDKTDDHSEQFAPIERAAPRASQETLSTMASQASIVPGSPMTPDGEHPSSVDFPSN